MQSAASITFRMRPVVGGAEVLDILSPVFVTIADTQPCIQVILNGEGLNCLYSYSTSSSMLSYTSQAKYAQATL